MSMNREHAGRFAERKQAGLGPRDSPHLGGKERDSRPGLLHGHCGAVGRRPSAQFGMHQLAPFQYDFSCAQTCRGSRHRRRDERHIPAKVSRFGSIWCRCRRSTLPTERGAWGPPKIIKQRRGEGLRQPSRRGRRHEKLWRDARSTILLCDLAVVVVLVLVMRVRVSIERVRVLRDALVEPGDPLVDALAGRG